MIRFAQFLGVLALFLISAVRIAAQDIPAGPERFAATLNDANQPDGIKYDFVKKHDVSDAQQTSEDKVATATQSRATPHIPRTKPEPRKAYPLAETIVAANRGKWARVAALRSQIKDPAAQDVIEWMRLRAMKGNFQDCQDFVARNADWPGLELLRKSCENSIPRKNADPKQVIAFFADQLPQTGAGALRLAEALSATERKAEAEQQLKRAWLIMTMTKAEHNAFVQRHGKLLKNLHETRIDRLLLNGEDTAARRMYPLVSNDWKKLAEARIALKRRKRGVDRILQALPASMKDDPGLAYERFVWRARRGRDDGAIEILLERSDSYLALGHPEKWANRRRYLAREMMRDGKPELGYQIAASHFLTGGSDYADLEWLAGYIALRKLDQPQTAVKHFLKFQKAVATPISLGRAGYWLGRAYEANGEPEKAQQAYEFGGQYQSSFYGQLAAEKANVPPLQHMVGSEVFSDWRDAEFTRSSVYAAAMQLHAAADHPHLTKRFFLHLSESQDRTGLGQMTDMALELGETHIALLISKQAARGGLELYKGYFPVVELADRDWPVDPTFILTIVRRESEFDHDVISPAGARGLMQLMPATAKTIAQRTNEEYSRDRLLNDPDYNTQLGAAYLAELSKRFDDNPVLVAAAYNAGPGQVKSWMRRWGDPRTDEIDMIDWIEHIPFRETQNYVMRATESFAPYRARLSGKVSPIQLSQDINR